MSINKASSGDFINYKEESKSNDAEIDHMKNEPNPGNSCKDTGKNTYYAYTSESYNNGNYLVANSSTFKAVKSIEKLFTKLCLMAETRDKEKGRRNKHMKIDDIATAMIETDCVCGISFTSASISEVDPNDILRMYKLPRDNVFMLILKSDPNTIIFISNSDKEKEDK